LALTANIILGWNGLQGTNILAYYKHSLVMVEKSFKALGLGCKGTTRINSLAYFRPGVTDQEIKVYNIEI
jgi:hypothetical protein